MKYVKLALAMVVLTIAVMAHAEGEDSKALWENYSVSKAKGHDLLVILESGSGTTSTAQGAVEAYTFAAKSAASLGREDVEVWCWNNSAYAMILAFKTVTGWTATNDEISAMANKSWPEKKARLEAVKLLQAKAEANWGLLQTADDLIAKAVVLSDESSQQVINSNKAFIKWVAEFKDKKF